jgi:tetratricopeptide (TPR) repeat protein
MVRTEKLRRAAFGGRLFSYPYFTAQLPVKSLQDLPDEQRRSPLRAVVSPPRALGVVLLALCLYAAFAHGAVASGDEERLQLAIAVTAALAGALGLATGALRLAAPRLAWAGVGLLAALAAWSGVTLAWSVAPDQTWIESTRTLTDVLVLVLALCFGASHPRPVRLLADGFALVAVAVSLYALGQKLAPGVRIAGLLDLDRTGAVPRLQDPLGYWNALGMFVALGVAPVLAVAADPRRDRRLRPAAAVAAATMLVTIAFTYSRGAFVALAAALLVFALASGGSLRVLLWLGLSVAAALPAAVIGLAAAPLTTAGAALGARERAGAELLVVLGACLLALVLGAFRLLDLERRVRFGAARRRALSRGLVIAGVGVVCVLLAVAAVSSRGLTGTASHAWHSFTATRTSGVADPARLLSADSENRWGWWKEAVGAFAARPLGGWGAGAFGVVHLLYRRDTLSVQQPHSVPLQFLVETGVIGAALAMASLAALLAAAARAVRSTGERGRLVAAALLAGVAGYVVHCLYDWDWDIPAVTLPVLAFVGVLAGDLARDRQLSTRPAASRPRPATPRVRVATGLAVVLAAVALAAFAASAVLPRLAATGTQRALATAGTSAASLRAALREATNATRIDPLSDAGPRAAATLVLRDGRPQPARRDLIEAIDRQPADAANWRQLTLLYLITGEDRNALVAARRALALDPLDPTTAALAQRVELAQAPPRASATAARAGG